MKNLDAKKEKEAAEKWGVPYVKMPRSIINRMRDFRPAERRGRARPMRVNGESL